MTADEPRTVMPGNSAGAVTVTAVAQIPNASSGFRPGTPASRM